MTSSQPFADARGAGLLSVYGELIKRLGFLLGALWVYRMGAHVPVPGVDPSVLSRLFSQQSNTILGLFNMFSGGALQRLTVFALGIMPYISASIMVQLLTMISPTLGELKKEGESGRRKINQYIRYATLGLALMQSLGITKYLAVSGAAIEPNLYFYCMGSLTLVTGTMFLMWLGEQITERGIGNGISMLIFAGIVAGIPSALGRLFEQVREGQLLPLALLLLLGMVACVTALVVFIERGQRRIPVHYARRLQQAGRTQASLSHLPLKLNIAGVIPPIFASSLVLFPATLAQWLSHTTWGGFLSQVGMALAPGRPMYVLIMVMAIAFFAFVYTALVFNPKETADNLKKSNALVPGIRPGDKTAQYLDKVMTRITVFGALYLVMISLLPEFFVVAWHVPFYLGGTSLLITVVVVMDFWSQLQSFLMSQQYAGLMKKANLDLKQKL